MKEFIIYLHTTETQKNSKDTNWIEKFTVNLKNALEKFDINVKTFTYSKDSFIQSIGGATYGVYLPVINKEFINSDILLSEFTSIVNEIENGFIQNAFHLSIIEDILPINYAKFQPFSKFYNQGQISENNKQKPEEFLPGNNTLQSFQKGIYAIAKDISDQLLKLLSHGNGKKKVFIGTSTTDLDEPLKSLYNFLIEQNIEVATPFSTANLGDAYIEKKLTQIISQCWLVIHPFGSGPIPINSILNNDLNLCKLESNIAAKKMSDSQPDDQNENPFKRIIWLPKKVSSSTYESRIIDWIKNQAIQNKNAEIIECSLDELKKIILDYYIDIGGNYNSIQNSTALSGNINADIDFKTETSKKETVFVINENDYAPFLEPLSKILVQNNLKMITCNDLDSSKKFLEEKNTTLENCKGVIILASSWNSSWFKSNINEILKIKSVRKKLKYDFICVMSKEISQLPYSFDKNLTLLPIKGQINSDMVTTTLFNNKKK